MNYEAARLHMVDSQIKTNRVTDVAVLEAFESVPREMFLPETRRGVAYIDEDLPLGNGRYMMEPMVLARLVQAAAIKPSDVVLDIGCGSGYSSAIMAKIAATVVAVESDKNLANMASEMLERNDFDNVVVVGGDLREGYPKQAPYDAILVNGAVSEVPEAILEQLADGGRLVTVQRGNSGVGRAVLIERFGKGVSSRALFDAATPFLPGYRKDPGFVF
jgi:protein-L-isoaspartate(D-aspartate) O-methyltransferase